MNCLDYKKYPAVLQENPDHTYTVFLRNWDGAISEGDTLEEAQQAACDLLADVIEGEFAAGEIIPPAAPAQEGDYIIPLTLDAAIKIVLRNCMTQAKCKKADLARGLNIPPQRIKGFLNLNKSTNLETLSSAFGFLGKNLSAVI